MLQISTGKFFEDEKKRRHDERFVFYSNIQIYSELIIASPNIVIEQVESGGINCFVVSYQLITEKHDIVIKCGEQDFISQFLLVWSFFFDCIAKNQKEIVQKICREKKSSSHDQKVAVEISPNTVKLARKLEKKEIDGFKSFFESLMATNRKTYKSIIAALKIIDDSKETISTNFDLAYSTLVYAIESLSQKHDGYTPNWDDYHDDVRKKIEPILLTIEEEKSDSIKKGLIEGKQFRLRKRLEIFVQKNLSHSFYHVFLGENTNTLRVSFLVRCLNNLYQLRSSFVHELKPLDVMLSSPHSATSDYIMRHGEPYFTYSGLNRLIREVIINFVKINVTGEIEKIEWTTETSSVVTMEVAAEYWIHNPNGFNERKVNKWFSEYIEMLSNQKVTDQSKIMSKIESNFNSAKKQNKRPLIHYYWLYNAIHSKENNDWNKFINKNHQYLGKCFHFYVVILYLHNELSYRTSDAKDELKPVDLNEFDVIYEKYLKERFYKSGLSLSGYTDAALLSAAANIALSNNEIKKFEFYLNKALPEVVNKRNKYSLIEEALTKKEKVDLKAYFNLNNADK